MTVETVVARLLFVLLTILSVVLEFVWEGLCRWIGCWTLRILSFGRYHPDEDNGVCALIGMVEIIAIVWGVVEWVG